MTAAGTSPDRDAVVLRVTGLSREFGGFLAVDSLDFAVPRGLTGFLGPNGAGKTTTFRMLAGSLGPTTGRVEVLGHDLAIDPRVTKRLIGYMPEAPPLYPEMTVAEYLSYRARLRDASRQAQKRSIADNVARTRIGDVFGTPIGHLSKGYRQRVALADALLCDPPLLLLDEPTAGLDPNQVGEVRALLAELGRERAVLLSTHVLSEVEATCERALVIHRGRLVASGSLAELSAQARGQRAELLVRGELSTARNALEAAGLAVSKAEREGDAHRLEVEDPMAADAAATIERAVAALVGVGLLVRGAQPERAALDEVFRTLTRDVTETATS